MTTSTIYTQVENTTLIDKEALAYEVVTTEVVTNTVVETISSNSNVISPLLVVSENTISNKDIEIQHVVSGPQIVINNYGSSAAPSSPVFTRTNNKLTRVDYSDSSYKLFNYYPNNVKLHTIDYYNNNKVYRRTFNYVDGLLHDIQDTII
jgi:hypothetical protein